MHQPMTKTNSNIGAVVGIAMGLVGVVLGVAAQSTLGAAGLGLGLLSISLGTMTLVQNEILNNRSQNGAEIDHDT